MNQNSRIRDGIDAIRNAPAYGKENTLRALRKPGAGRLRLAGAIATIAVIGGIAAMSAWPKPSLAAELQQIKRADLASTSVIERNWQMVNGKYELFNEVVRWNGQYVMRFKDAATQYFDGRRITNDYGAYATVQDRGSRNVANRMSSIEDLVNLEAVTGYKMGDGATPDVIRCEIDWKVGDRQGKIELLADRKTRRPLRQEGIGGNSVGFKYEWIYKDLTAADVTFKSAKGYPVYDIDAQRSDFLKMLGAAKGTSEKPTLVAAYRDETNHVVAFLCGEAGFDAVNLPPMAVNGQTGDLMMHSWNTFDAGWQNAAVYQGKQISAHFVALKANPGSTGTITLDVTTKSGVKTMTFPNVPIRRCAVLNMLFAPMNVPFFLDNGNDPMGTKATAASGS